MKHITRPFTRCTLLIVAVLILFSCENSGDPREKTRRALGEPDDIIQNDYASFKSELWVYARSDINRVYEFSQSSTGCGGSGEWYLNRQYYADYHFGYTLYDPPPVITHTPVEKAPPGVPLTIEAQVTLNKKAKTDKVVKRVNIQYCDRADTLTTFIVMSITDEEAHIYTGEIPGEDVTENGLEYYLEATSDGSHWSRLPKAGFYVVEALADTLSAVSKANHTDTTRLFTDDAALPEPDTYSGRTSPVSP